MKRQGVIVIALVMGMAAAVSRTAAAQGYGVYEQGACTMAMGGAAVASPCDDGSAMFFNPAALVTAKRTIGLSSTFIAPKGGFTDTTTKQQSDLLKRVYPVPAINIVMPFGKKAAFGLALNAPYGLATEWNENTSQGRFLGYKSKVSGIYIQPSVAFQLNDKFSLGFGIDITSTQVELRQRIDLSTQAISGTTLTFAALGVPKATDFADVQLKGDSKQAGFHVGALVKANEKVSFGVRYLSRQKANVTGDVTTAQISTGLRLPIALSPSLPAGTPIDAILTPLFQSGARLSNQTAKTVVYFPDQFVMGVAVQATDKVKVLADYQFTNWSLFDELNIVGSAGLSSRAAEAYKNTSGIRLGIDAAVTKRLNVRGGFIAHGGAAPDETVTPNLPEGKRTEYTMGFGASLTDNLRFDFAYQYLHQSERAGRTTSCGVDAPTVACNNGVYKFHANLLGAGLVLKF